MIVLIVDGSIRYNSLRTPVASIRFDRRRLRAEAQASAGFVGCFHPSIGSGGRDSRIDGIASDQCSVYGADRRTDDPVGFDTRFMEPLDDASLVSA